MIYILSGNETKRKHIRATELTSDNDVVFLQSHMVTSELLLNYATQTSLFGTAPVIKVENLLSTHTLTLTPQVLTTLKDSATIFILLEDKLLAADEKKYSKYATVEKFEEKITKALPKFNMFSITDAFERKDKVLAWRLYLSAIDLGIEPEAISGVLFWKIKTMLLHGSKAFAREGLISQSSALVCLYHDAHRGETDFVVGLEQFILSSLSK